MKFLAAPALIIALIASSGPAAAADEHFRMLTIGEMEEFALEGIPGTGHEWLYDAKSSWNPDRVLVESMGYGEPLNDAIGGPAHFTFGLTPRETGMARLEFVYSRSWENDKGEPHTLWVFVRGD
jgi:predicted secreted protein